MHTNTASTFLLQERREISLLRDFLGPKTESRFNVSYMEIFTIYWLISFQGTACDIWFDLWFLYG